MGFRLGDKNIEETFAIPSTNNRQVEGMAVGEKIIFLRRERVSEPVITRDSTTPSHDTIRYSWPDITNVSGYEYELWEGTLNNNIEDVTSGTITDTNAETYSYEYTELDQETSYVFRIRSIATNDSTHRNSRWVNDEFTTIRPRLDTPQNVRTTQIFADGVTVAWNSVTNATAYRIEIVPQDDPDTVEDSLNISDVSSLQATLLNDLRPLINYTVRVYALAPITHHESLPGEVNFTTLTKDLPALTFTATVNETLGNVNFNWYLGDSLSEHSSDGVSSYELTVDIGTTNYYTNDSIFSSATGAILTRGDIGRGGDFSATLTVNTMHGYNSRSSTITFSLDDFEFPTFTVSLLKDNVDFEFDIDWTNLSNFYNDGIDDIRIDFLNSNSLSIYNEEDIIGTTREKSYGYGDVISTLGTYSARVSIFGVDGWEDSSATSNTVEITAADVGVPEFNVVLVKNEGNSVGGTDSLDATWDLPDSASSLVSSFNISLVGSTIVRNGLVNTTRSESFNYLDIGSLGAYSVRVVANGVFGTGSGRTVTSSSQTIAQQTLINPTDITFSSITTRSFSATWDVGDARANRWAYRLLSSDRATTLASGTLTSASYSSGNVLSSENTYIFEVLSQHTNITFYAAQENYYSENITTERAKLRTPTSLRTSNVTGTNITASWNSVTRDTEGNTISGTVIYAYSISTTGEGTGATSGTVTARTVTFTGLTAGITYTISVYATLDNYDNSDTVSLMRTTFLAIPVRPTITEISYNGSTITVKWNEISNADSL